MDKPKQASSPQHRSARLLNSGVFRRVLTGHATTCPAVLTETQDVQAAAVGVPCSAECVEADCSGVRVAILVNARVGWGERIAVVGQDEVLGSWQASGSLPLSWCEGDVWQAQVELPPGVHEFKCVTIKTDGQLEWEVGGNRVIQVPQQAAGLVEARCRWADTANTTVAVPLDATQQQEGATAMDASLAGSGGASISSSSASEMSEAFRSCSSDSGAGSEASAGAGSIRSHQLAAPLTLSSDDGGASTAPGSARESGCGGQQPQHQPQQHRPQEAAAPQQGGGSGGISLVSADSSGDVSMYTVFDAGLPPMPPAPPRPQQQQQPAGRALTAASLKEAAAADARARGGAQGGGGGGLRQGGAAAPRPVSVSSSPYSGVTGPTPASSLLSPLGTESGSGQLLPHGTISSSTLSFSSLGASEAVMDESEEVGGLMDEGLASLAASEVCAGRGVAPLAVGGATSLAAATGDPAQQQQQQLLDNAAVYEQLMAVEPELLLLEQAQQRLIQQQADAALQAVRAANNNSSSSASMGAFGAQQQSAPAARAAAAGGSGAGGIEHEEDEDDDDDVAAREELLDAVAELYGGLPGSILDVSTGLLPSEDTLPPTALCKFAALAEIQEASDGEEAGEDGQQQHQHGGAGADADLLLDDGGGYRATTGAKSSRPRVCSDAGAQRTDAASELADVPPRRHSSSSSSSSRLSKDQLPCLGLTVNVPSAAAMAAAQMHAANEAAAAAAAAAARARPSYAGGDALEVPRATEGLTLVARAHCIPHVDKTHTGGEDAHFISTAGHGALGVSDGVSAWAEDGIDPGEYSRTLVQYCAEAFEERVLASAVAANQGAFVAKFDPRALLRYAQQCTCKPGSATMVLAAMQPGGALHVANLGDCGIKVVREGRVVYETKPQQHDFNLPYQLSHPQLFPDTDTADSADRYTWQVQEGDVVVAASDGLFDNLWDDELLALLQQGLLGITPMDTAGSLSRAESTSSIGSTRGSRMLGGLRGRHSRSSSTSQLPTLVSAPSTSALPVFAAAAVAGEDGGSSSGGDSSGQHGGGMSRSRSTSHLSSWGAKQLRRWKSGSKPVAPSPPTAFASAAAPSADAGSDGSGPDQSSSPPPPPPPPLTLAEVGPDAVARAAELLAAAAASHAADKEFRSPWSVAAGRAYGLLARLFAKGGKMDDVTCVVGVVQQAGKGASAAADAAAAAQQQAQQQQQQQVQQLAGSDVSCSSGGSQQDQQQQLLGAKGSNISLVGPGVGSSDLSPSDDSSVGAPCLTSEGSGLSAAAIIADELQ